MCPTGIIPRFPDELMNRESTPVSNPVILPARVRTEIRMPNPANHATRIRIVRCVGHAARRQSEIPSRITMTAVLGAMGM
jgi:hypothetical protein